MLKYFSFLSATQWLGIAKIIAPVLIGGISTYLGASTTETITSVLAIMLPALGLSINAHTTANMAQAVAAEPGLKVTVSPEAAPALLKLASDTSVPDVIHAPPDPPKADLSFKRVVS
jgi:hypothetical protein